MITIKKADGTFDKVPLSEFKKMQAVPRVVIPTAVEESLTPDERDPSATYARDDKKPAHHQAKHHAAPHHSTPHHTPAHQKTHTEHAKTSHRQAKPMARIDAGSLLEEKIPAKGHGVLFSPKREKQVEMVISKLGFSVAPDLLGRLKSLVLARLKDLKSEDEARELLSRSVKNGGLGLTEPQVEKVIQLCHEVGEMEHPAQMDVPALKGKNAGLLPMVEPSELPAIVSEVKPISYNKINVVGRVPTAKPSVIPTKVEESLTPKREGSLGYARDDKSSQDDISQMIKQTAASEPIFKLNTQAAVRKSMQDVTASSMEMGPAEEIKSTTLTDFRRLSGNPEEAARRLQQKMFNLQDESFVLYLDALSAYHLSPIYTEYMRAVCQSLVERKSLANLLAMKNSIKLNEMEAIVEMERSL